MSGNQSSVRYALNRDLGDPREQIRRQTSHLLPGTIVRVFCYLPPVPFDLIGFDPIGFSWYRTDLYWDFIGVGNNPEWANKWREQADYLRGFND